MDSRPAKKSGGGPFEKLGLCKTAALAAYGMGFNLPTPIQRKAIPAILSETGDVLANARTGSGKTAAFMLPVIHKLRGHSQFVGVRALVVLPTRELAMQTGLVLRKMLKHTGRDSPAKTLRTCYLIGGMSMAKQFEHLSNNPDIIICTPGRLVHQLVESELRLTRVETLIFDEGDMLFEMGFEDDVNRILKAVSSCVKKQIVIASATLPTQLVQFAKAKLQNPQFIYLDAEQCLPDSLELQLLFIRPVDKTAALIFWLEHVMPPDSQCIVFCATGHHVAYLAEVLKFYQKKFGSELFFKASGCRFKNGPFSCTQLTGQLVQGVREDAMDDFRKMRTRILLATDVAARGVDIDKLDYVVHYTFPSSPKLFVHRAGRTARKGQKGTCVSFVSREEMPYLMELLLFAGKKLEIAQDAATKDLVAELDDEIKKYSFDFGLGEKVERVVTTQSKRDQDTVPIGGVPDLNDYREIIGSALVDDVGIQRLAVTMAGGEKAYMRHRQPASKQSLKRAARVFELLGGPAKLAEAVHPVFTDVCKAQSDLRKNLLSKNKEEKDSIFADFKFECKTEEEPGLDFGSSEPIDRDFLLNFRPKLAKKAHKGLSLPGDVVDDFKSMRSARVALKDATQKVLSELAKEKSTTVDREDAKPEADANEVPAAFVSKVRISKAARKHAAKGQSAEVTSKRLKEMEELTDFAVAADRRDEVSVARELGLSLNSNVQIKRSSFGLLGDDLTLSRRVTTWNAAKKSFTKADVDRKDVRVVKNDAGARVETKNVGLYKRWMKTTQRRIQYVGELEDAGLASQFEATRNQRRVERFGTGEEMETDAAERLLPLTALTTNQGLLEKLERKMPLTHKETRLHRKLLKRQANPIVTGTDKDPVLGSRKSKRKAAAFKTTASKRVKKSGHKRAKKSA